MTLGPGTLGGSITSDNISPMHLLNVKRLAFETNSVTAPAAPRPASTPRTRARASASGSSWIADVEANLLARAGNPAVRAPKAAKLAAKATTTEPREAAAGPLGEAQIQALIRRFRKG